MPPRNYPYFSTDLHSSWSEGLGRWLRTMKVAAIAGTVGAAAGTIGAIAIVAPRSAPAPVRNQIVSPVEQILTRPPTRPESIEQHAPLATASSAAVSPHPPAENAAGSNPPLPPGWPLLPGARPHNMEAAVPASTGLYDRVEAQDRAAAKAPPSATALSPAPERADASSRVPRRTHRSKKPQVVTATAPATELPVPRPPTVIVPSRAATRGAHARHRPDRSGNWRYASRSNYGDYDRDDWRDRDYRGGDRSGWGGGGFFGPLGNGGWGN